MEAARSPQVGGCTALHMVRDGAFVPTLTRRAHHTTVHNTARRKCSTARMAPTTTALALRHSGTDALPPQAANNGSTRHAAANGPFPTRACFCALQSPPAPTVPHGPQYIAAKRPPERATLLHSVGLHAPRMRIRPAGAARSPSILEGLVLPHVASCVRHEP